MQAKHSLVILILSVLTVISACREPNPFHCPDGKECVVPPEECGNIKCEAPTPVCKSEDTGTCVACTSDNHCPGETVPRCDTATNACVECLENADCESGLCLGNSCVNPDDVAFVSEIGGTNNQMCSKDMPCQTLGQALDVSRKYIKITGRFDAAATINGDMVVLETFIYGEPGMTTFTRAADGSVLKIEKGAKVSLFDIVITGISNNGVGLEIKDAATKVSATRVSIHGHKGTGVQVTAGTLTMNDSQVYDNSDTGVFVAMAGTLMMRDSKVFQNQIGVNVMGGTLGIDHSLIYKNTGAAAIQSTMGSMVTIGSSVIGENLGTYALSIAGNFAIKNNIISANGNPSATTAGVLLSSGTGTFEFNTVSDNATVGADLGISCVVPNTKISNSILTGNAVGATCEVTHSMADTLITGMGNKTGVPMYIKLQDPLDPTFYRIMPGSDAKDSADPSAREAKDIDGQARSDSRNDMGADEYTQ